MAIELDGEKYACEACVRGHRVSNCTHRDRELRHINKKGRPVSQCPHCRGLRKSRSAHVKCVCAEVGHGQTSSSNPPPTITLNNASGPACSCMHGQACNCSLKREHCDVNEIARTAAMNATHRRSASSGKPAMSYRRSDSTVPNVRHSFHPSLHHRNNAAHEHGMPYPLKRASASHGSLGMSSVQRSVDNLPLQAYSTNPAQLGNWPPIPQLPSQDMRSARSAQTSPMLPTPPVLDVAGGAAGQRHEPSLLSRSMSPGNPQRHSMHDFSTLWNPEFNTTGDFGQPAAGYLASSVPSSATESLPMNWSELDLASSYQYHMMAQQNPPAPSVDSVDPQPSLSRSSSGTASDTADSSHTNFGDFNFGALSQPSMDSLSSHNWQAGSWQGQSALDFEDAFNQQKTPKAPHPENHIGNMSDYFGDFSAEPAPSNMSVEEPSSVGLEVDPAPWSSDSPDPSNYSGVGGLMMPAFGGEGSEAWSSQIDLSSYANAEILDIKQEHQGSASGSEQFSWSS